MKLAVLGVLTGALWIAGGAVLAAESAQPEPQTATTPTPATAGRVETRIASAFATFAGSKENAQSLVTGLRQGGEITLNASGAGGQGAAGTTFTVPTRPMGYGNTYLSLALAREQLAQQGITQPTPEQLKAALVGGSVNSGTGASAQSVELRGVLTMRAEGMGWGRIANTLGVKLGHVVSGMKHATAPASTPGALVNTTPSTGGVTTAAGSTAGRVGHGHGEQARGRANAGAGIVTAAGTSAAGSGAGVRTHAGGAGHRGIVSGAGGGSQAASGAGLGLAKGHAKH